MTLSITSAFDGGNIHMVSADGDRVDLEIRKDHQSDFYQWFYFRVTGAAGRELELRILNAGGSSYPLGWPDYRACISYDRDEWERTDPTLLTRLEDARRKTPPKAWRFIGEFAEMQETFADAGLPDGFAVAAGTVVQLLAGFKDHGDATADELLHALRGAAAPEPA